MKEFDVQVVLKVTQYTDVIRIEAENEEEAYDIACEMYSNGELNIDEGEDIIEETVFEVNEVEDGQEED